MRRPALAANFFLLIALLMLIMSSAKSEDPYALKCQSADGKRQFPAVRPPYALRTSQDKNAFQALLRTLGITFEQYQAWGVKCQEIMGLDDPRPYSRELSEQEFRKRHAACLPPDDVAAKPHGSVLHKITKGCTETLTKNELAFVVGIISVGIDECGFSNDRPSRLLYARATMFTLTPDLWQNVAVALTPQVQMAEGTQFARGLQCGQLLKSYTADGISYLRSQ
jgi:hypothetical protein